MKELSYANHVVPKLSIDGVAFAIEAVAKLNDKQVAHPGSLLAKIYWDVIEVLTDMLDILEAPSASSQAADRRHRAVLRHAEILMLRCTSLNDYLRKLLSACAPDDAERELNQCCAAIETRLGKNIKIPINKTKHDGFTLAPITLTNGVASVPGFVVYGPLPDGATGPLSFSAKHGANTPEGYSLPLFMRRALALTFEMTDLARDQLLKWGAITPSAETAEAHNPNDVRIEELFALLERLNGLPHHGFQGEHTVRSPMFQVKERTMTMQMVPTRRLRGTVKVEFQIPAVHAGSPFQMPYWDQGRRK